MNFDFYPYGTQYYRAPTPLPDEWEYDLSEIARAGYTHIQLRPQWKWHEQRHQEYYWDDQDTLMDLADKYSLKVIIKPMLETAPDWVFEELGGTRIGFNSMPIPPIAIGSFYVGGWLPCFDNPKVITAAEAFVEQLTQRYKDHPALWFYDAWNEPRSRPLGQCQCEHSVAAYRKWLTKQYGTIENLNSKLGKAWASFDTIKPPTSAWDYAEMFLWRQWATHAVAGHVQMVTDVIKRADPKAFVMVHVGFCSVLQDTACDASDDLLTCKSADRFGTSFPVDLHPVTPIQHACPDLISDWLRRVDSSYWCHEFYPNHGNWCVPPDPVALNRLVWLAISGGAQGFTYWQHRSERLGNETNGYGLREIDGSPTERSRVADDIAAVLKLHGHKLAGTTRTPSKIALLYSRESDLLSRIAMMPEMFTKDEKESWDYPYKNALKAAHALYLYAGQTVDIVVPGDNLADYDLLHVTCAEMIDADTADWLRDYARKGGKLIVEFPFACRDNNTWVSNNRPNHNLDDLLGCKESNRTVICDNTTAEFADGAILSGQGWKTVLFPDQAEVLAKWTDDYPAAAKNQYGSGTVYSLGVSISLSFTDCPDDPAHDVLNRLLNDAGINKSQVYGSGVWVRRRKSQDREIWFIFNVSDSIRQIGLPYQPGEVWQDLGCTLDGTSLSIPAGATWVAEFKL